MRYVYADNAATTPVSKKVVEAMLPYMTEHYGNPSSLYSVGQTAARAVDKARAQVAEALGADAIVNIRYASSAIMQGAAEVIAYGPAVKFV